MKSAAMMLLINNSNLNYQQSFYIFREFKTLERGHLLKEMESFKFGQIVPAKNLAIKDLLSIRSGQWSTKLTLLPSLYFLIFFVSN